MRNVISLNEGWKFIQEDAGLPAALPADWQDVTLPHSWNAVDGMDGNGSYTRGTFWYARSFATPKQPLPGGRVYVQVNAAGQQADVYVNGEKVGEQTGEHVFSFRVPLTGEIEVKAVAGDCTDTASFRHVDTPNPSYKLVKTKSKSANWV